MILSEVIDGFIGSYEGRDPSLSGRLQFWRDALGQHELTAIDAEMVDAELVKLVERGVVRNVRGAGVIRVNKPLSPATVNRYRAALASVIKYAKRRRLIKLSHRSPLADIPCERESAGRLEYLTVDQIEQLIVQARLASWKKLPALVLMAFQTGLRRGSLMGLRWRDIDLEAGTATVARTKNGDPHVATLTERMIGELRKIGPSTDPEELVFSSAKGINRPHDFRASYAKALKEAKLPAVTFHALRHSTATHMARSGAPLLAIADVMAHKSISMTKRYSHLCVADRANVTAKYFGVCA